MDNNVVAKHILDVAVGLEKKSKTELITELSDIFDNASKIDLNSKENIAGLKSLAKAFEAIFDKAGNKTINFADLIEMPPPAMFAEMGKIAATSFWDAFNAVSGGIGGGVSQDMLRDQFNQLKKQRAELVRQQKALPQKQKRYEELSLIADDLPYMDENEFEAFTKKEIEKMGINVDKIALDMQQAMVDALDKLSDISLDAPEYDKALEDAFEKTQKVFKMSRTLEKHPDLVIDKTILDDYDFKYLQETFGEDLEAHSIRLSGLVRKVVEEMDAIPLKLKEIDEQILQIQNNGIEIVDQTSAKNGLKALNEIEEAYKRVLTQDKKRAQRPDQKKVAKIEKSLAFDPSTTDKGIQTLYDQYLKAQASGNWEEEYQALLKYVRLYEEYRQSANKTHRNKVTRSDNPFTPLYEQLKPMAENAQNALQNIVNMAKDQPLVGMGGAGGDVFGDASDEVANAERIAEAKRIAAEAEAKAKVDAEAKAQAEKIAREEAEKKAQAERANEESLKKQRIEQEKLVKAAEKERLAKDAAAEASLKASQLNSTLKDELMSATKQQLEVMNGRADAKESMRLVGADGILDVTQGKDYSIDATTMVKQLVANLKNSIIMSLHDHPNAMDAFTPSDVESFAKLYYDQGVKVNGIIANGVIKTIDFTGISKEMAIKIGQSFSENLSKVAKQSGIFSYEDGNIIPDEKVDALAQSDPEKYQTIMGGIIESVNVSLDEAFQQNGLESTVKTFKTNQLPELTKYLLELQRNGQNAVAPVEKLKNLITSLKPNQTFEWSNYTDILNQFENGAIDGFDAINQINTRLNQEQQAHTQNTEAIKAEALAQEQLNNTKNGSSMAEDDDTEILSKENGALEDKLELLRDIAEQYGHNITQKQRDRFEELNQKDMNEGLTAREDERYWELGEQIEEADNALEDFEQTYDRIIVKLANGKSVEILPDDKGLRTLAKIDEEYGESYNGIEIEDVIYERIQNEAVAAEQAVDALNDSIEETKNVTQSSGGGTGTGDASSAELEAAVTKTEALQDEVEQKNKELADKDAEIARVRAENEAKLKTEADEKNRLQEDLNAKNQQLADVQHENELYDTALAKAEEESNVKDGVIRDLREQLANVKTGTGEEQASVSSEELKNVLSSIVYNVKITHDDNDKTANKIAIDESVLESTLKRVFTNILNPHTEQNDLEPNNEPWALEKTLQTVKETLDVIKTNTAKPDSVEVAPAKTDVGNVLATENTLAAIKIAVESINTKIVKGTKDKTSSGGGKKTRTGKKNSESYDGSRYFPEKLKTQTMQLAKFRAQMMTTGKLTDDVDAQIYELLDGLKQVQNGPDFSEWSQKFQQLKTSVGITDIFDKAEDKDIIASYKQLVEFQKERNKLELQYEKAQDGSALKQFYAEQLAQMNSVIAKQEEMLENEEYEARLAKIREEQARKLGEVEAKAVDKAAKKAAADQKKLDKRRAMTGKAGSAIGRAEGVWLEAEGLEQAKLPEDFKKQINEYYDALDKLRVKHHEINTSEVVTDEQQAELIAQTKEVNRLTEDIGSLVVEYQKLSGSNVDEADSRATTLTGKSGLSEYETTLKQYVRDITNGKGQIKSFNAETKTLTYTVKTGKNEFTEYTAAVRNLDHQLVSVQGTTKRTETFFEATARKMKELTSYFSGMAIFNRIGQELRRGIQYIREIDLALTELKKVTDETEETYDKFLDTAAKTGARLGTTISAVTEATATFAKLGYAISDATEMAEAAIVYKNVGDNIESTEDAADSIISTMKGFKLEATEAMKIVDRFNEVGNRFAITSQGIGEALRLSASALSEGGNSLDESIGLITAANEVVNDPSSVGKK